MANIGYIRVSSVDQCIDRQLDGVELDETFIDRASGKDTERPEFQNMLRFARRGDVIHVHSLDRLARNMNDLCGTLTDFVDRGVQVKFHKEGLVFERGISPMSELLLHLLGAFAQFERSLIRERQREGIEKAKAAGKYKGRKPSLTDEQVAEAKASLEAGVPLARIARTLHVGRSTLYNYLRD